MDRRRIVIGVLWMLLALGGVGASDAGEAEDGFVPMFDGKTLARWKTTGNWIVEEGGVVALHPRPGEHGWQRYDAYLTTARKYKDFVLDLEFKINKAGQWNRYVITCQGTRLKVELNGEQIIDLDLDKSAVKDRALEGYIGFQDEAKPVWYRNVRIKEL